MLESLYLSTNKLTAILRDSETKAPITTATVTATIKAAAGTVIIAGASLPHVAAGAYKYTMAYNLLPTEDGQYYAEISVIDGTNRRFARVWIKNKTDVD